MAANTQKIANECWKRGTIALERQNWDYAVAMFRQSAQLVGDNLLYRQTLRGATEKKYNGNGSGARGAKMRLMGTRGKIKKARMTKNWEQLDGLAEDGLAVNPWDSQLNTDLADACVHRADAAKDAGDEAATAGFQNIAIDHYKRAINRDKDNKELYRSLGDLLEERGEYMAAVSCWHKISQLDPDDSDARAKSVQLQADSTIERGGFEAAESTRGVMADHEIAKRLGTSDKDKVDGPGMSERADLERAVRKEPESVDVLLKLADYYRRNKLIAEAEETLAKALRLSDGNVNISEQLEDVQLDQMRNGVQQAKDHASRNSDDADAKKQWHTLATDLAKREVEVLKARVARNPNDMRQQLDLAKLYMRPFKQWKLAIPLLQRSVSDTRVKGEALVRLGLCFKEDNKIPLARHQLEQATKIVEFDTNEKMYKEMLYLLGTICETQEDADAATEYYTQLLAVDYEYKDAVDRLEKLQGG